MRVYSNKRGCEVIDVCDVSEVLEHLYDKYRSEMRVGFDMDCKKHSLHTELEDEDHIEEAFFYWVFEELFVELEDTMLCEGWQIPGVLRIERAR